MYICEHCGKEFEQDYRKGTYKELPRFCSRACANSRIRTSEIKEKISNSMKTSEKAKEANKRESIKKHSLEWKESHSLPRITRICPVCGSEFKTTIPRDKKYCSTECWQMISGGYREGSGRSKAGYYKGIYCGSTYELCWVIYNLDHNIPFKKSKIQIPYTYQGKQHLYYPDFELEDGTLIEIKGYNTDLVQVKSEAAQQAGYKIKVLYKSNLQKIFDYIKNTYKVFDFTKLYDSSKKLYYYTCDICGKEFTRTKEILTDIKLCSRECSCKNANKQRYNK